MPNEFIARNGIIALNNSSITGSLNVTSSAVSTIAGNPTFDGDSILTIKNNNPSSFPTQVLALDSVRSDTPVDIKLGSSTPKGIRIYADNQVLTSSPAGAGFQFYRITDTNFPGQVYFDSGAHNNAAIIFRTAITSGTITERARIASNGNFLIGTPTDAGYRLDVNGTARVSGTALFTGNIGGNAWNYDSGNVRWVFGTATNQLSRFYTIQNAWTTTAATLAVRNIASQTANSLQIENSSSTVLSGFNASGSLFINKTTANATLDINGPTIITGSLTVTQGITGSLLGTASLATTASNALTASFVQNAVSASFAATASSADNFLVRGTLTAQTIVAQTITSSTDFVTGSTRFGSLSSNTHQFTGSVSITGSLAVNVATSSFVGSITSTGNGTFGGTIVGDRGDGYLYVQGSRAAGFYVQNLLGPINLYATGSSLINGYVTVRNSLRVFSDNDGLDGVYILSNTLNTKNRAGTNFLLIGAAETSSIKIFNNGNVLIQDAVSSGTSDPGYKFSVSGSARFRNNVEISGSFTVFTGSAVELQVTNTGVRIGNITTDVHTVTGSLNVSGSITATSNVLVTGSLLISTGSLSDFLRTSNAGVTNFRISSSGYPVWGVPGFDVISVPGATWTPIVTWDGTYVQWGDNRANRSIMTPGIGGGYVTVPNITFINATYATQVNNLFGNSFIVNNNNVTSTLGTVNMVIQATGSQTGNMLQFKNGAGSVLSGVDASGSLFINKTTANARLDVNGPTIISGSLTVFTGSAVELQVTNTGVRIGNIITDAHTVTGSFNVSGSITTTGTITAQTLVVQTITSSTDFVTGSTRFGSLLANTHQFTGSVSITGSLTADGNTTISGSTVISGSFTVFTGSAVEFQVTNTGVRMGNIVTDTHTVTGSFNISGSGFVQGGGFIVSGTLATSGSASQGLVAPLKFTTATANTNYTLVYTDEGKMVEMNNNADAPLTVTIPLNSSVPFPIGTEISIIQIGGGTTIITGSSGVTVYSSLGVKTLQNPYDVASVVKRGTDSWYLFGNLS
jgi:hypothetical protein